MFTKHKEQCGGKKRTTEAEERIHVQRNQDLSEEMNFQNLENVGYPLMKKSHLSIATDDGPTGEMRALQNLREVSSSWLVSQTVDTSKRTDLHKLTSEHALNKPTGIGFQGQKQQKILRSASCDFVEVAFGTSSPLQTHTPSMVAHAVSPKPTAFGACTPTSSPLPCMVQSTLPSNGDPSVSKEQILMPRSLFLDTY